MDDRYTKHLRVISLFEELTEPDLARVALHCLTRRYLRQVQIAGEQDAGSDVFFILDGSVRVSSTTAEGREVIYSELGKGDIFGEFAAIDGLPRCASVVATSDCLVARMTSDRFNAVVQQNGIVASQLIRLLVAKIRLMSERVLEISALAARERVRRELLRLANQGLRSGQSVLISPAPTHYELAARIGAHRETVTRELNRLEAEHIVRIARREIQILDLARLRAEHET